jgi:hypothetical protein
VRDRIAEGTNDENLSWPGVTRNEDGEVESIILVMLPKGTAVNQVRVASSVPASVYFVNENGNVFLGTSAHSTLDMAALGLASR